MALFIFHKMKIFFKKTIARKESRWYIIIRCRKTATRLKKENEKSS
ncbi:hypothetical protein BAME_00990 [Bacillus sp. M 2-6]|nr:hypothetical protein BAME_00990 [Bacillus sp. M 2-6]